MTSNFCSPVYFLLQVMTLERILLQTIKFDLQVEHPYTYLLKYAKCLEGDEIKLQKMVQMAWNFVTDSLCTTLALQWEPEIIAVALIYLASKLSKFEVMNWIGRTSKHLRWWDMFVEDVTMELLEDICHQILDYYSQSATAVPNSPPLLKLLPNGQEKNSVEMLLPTTTNPTPPPYIPPYPYPAIPPTESFTHGFSYTVPPIPGPHIAPPPPGPLPHIAASTITVYPPPFPAPPHYPSIPPNTPNNFYTPPPNSSATALNLRPPFF